MVPWYIYIIFKDIKSKRSHNYSVAAGSETFVRIRSGTDINVSDPDSNPDSNPDKIPAFGSGFESGSESETICFYTSISIVKN